MSDWLSPSVVIQGATALVTVGVLYERIRRNSKDIETEAAERKSEDREIREEMVRRDNTQWEHINPLTEKVAKIQGRLGVNGH